MTLKRITDIHAAIVIKKDMEVSREEYLDYMTFKSNDRPFFTEIFGPLLGLKEEWAEQGATPGELDFSAFRYRRAMDGYVPVNTGWMGGDEEIILEDTDEHIVFHDRMGRRMKLAKAAATLPLPMDYPVRNMDDWLKVKQRYEFSEERFGENWKALAHEHRQAGRVLAVEIPGGFDEPRQLMGEEGLCIAYYEQPELIHDILRTIGDTALKVLDRVSSAFQVDHLFVHEDMAGKNGPLVGPKQVVEFIRPYYRRVWDMLRDRGARLFSQDSDGNMNAVILAFLDAGVNFMYPMEPAAGMDMVKVRETYGRKLAFMGGIDKHVIRRTKKEIVAELEYKIPPMVRSGGCVLGLDHRIPNGTPLENYRFYVQKAWEIMNRERRR
ncbi:MAG: hypothetical protein K8R91_02950 [Phycisphaerae bacterium]|nr:hypothetical protein [Phycisphaerae bacterium]